MQSPPENGGADVRVEERDISRQVPRLDNDAARATLADALPPADELPPELDELTSDFEIFEEVGRGATAVVYRARERAIDRLVAIKVIRARYVRDDEHVARLEREARMVARLDHANVVALHTVRRLRHGSLALIMQFVDGRTARDLLREHGPPQARRVTRILADVARALAAAHSHGIVHRDVKPENIYLDRVTGRALLADFGAAAPLASDARLTLAGMTIGTPGYLAPELIDGRDATPRSDVFALGLVGWELTTGLQPWTGSTLLDILTFRKHGHLPRVDELRDDVPGALAEAIEGALDPDPDQRWSSAEAFLSILLGPTRPARRPRAEAADLAALLPPAVQPAAATVRFRRDQLPPIGTPAAAVAPADPNAEVPPARPQLAASASRAGADSADEESFAPVPRRRFAHLGPRRLAAAVALAAVFAVPFWLAGRDGGRERAGDVVATTTDAPATVTIPVVTATAEPTPAAGEADPAPGASEPEPDPSAEAEVTAAPARPELPPAASEQTAREPSGRPVAAARTTPAPPSPRTTRADVVAAAPAPPPPPSTAPAASPPAAVDAPAAPQAAPEPSAAEERAAAGFIARNVSLGGMHSCAVTGDGSAYCWGGSERGQTGDRSGSRAPRQLAAGVRFRSVSLGLTHSCGIAQDGSVHCWGSNDRGQLGDGTTTSRSQPAAVPGVGRVTALALGAEHTCALETGGTVRCWGNNESGQLGAGRSGGGVGGAVVVAWNEPIARITAGWHHTCGVTQSGRAVCWGSNQRGQLGDGSTTSRAAPVAVSTSLRFTSLTGGHSHSCGVSTTGAVHCWGRNHVGQLGDGSTNDARTPRPARLTGAVARVVAGSQHSCALLRSGGAQCWGQNSFGQLGDGTTATRTTPVRVVDAPAFAELEASSGTHTCGTTASGNVHCWGYNGYGQLGDGTRTNRSRPVLVARPGG